MRSHRSYLMTFFVIALFVFQVHQSANAQNVYIVVSSSVTHNATTNQINGVSQTSMDYRTNLYYRARAKGYIYTQSPSSPLAVSDNQGAAGQSVVSAQSQANAAPYTTYNLKTEHYLLPRSCGTYNCQYYNDYYNYYYSSPYGYYGAPSEFGATRTIYGCNPSPYQTCYPNAVYGWIWMGNTNTSVLSPPTLTITNSRVSGNLNGTTQNALLGSPADLQATVTPAGLGGNYVWTFTGPYTQDSSLPDNSYRSVFWTQPGTYTASVAYSGSGFSTSASVTIQIRVPTLTQFAGSSAGNVVDRGRNCSRMFNSLPYGASYSLGCSQNNAAGMLWSATASIPAVPYLSDPGDAGIQFKQIVSVYRKRLNNGRMECWTSRNPQSDPQTGWQLDATDPFHSGQYAIPSFFQGTTITAQEFDSPATPLDRNNAEIPSFEREAVFVDDLFETYVQYYTGSPHDPEFVRLLHVADAACPADRFDCGVDRLVWRWGGQVHYDASISITRYRETASSTSIGNISPTRTGAIRAYSGVAQSNVYSLCQGAANITNPIDGIRFFTQQLYFRCASS